MKSIKLLDIEVPQFKNLKKIPKNIWYIGNLDLLKRPMVTIVGTRRPSAYTKDLTYKLARELSKRGVVVVSGVAMGVDALAHRGAKEQNTIAVVANGLDIRYPAVNKKLIESIESKGLVLSIFEEGFRATKWSFVVRNELVVALGDCLIVTEADLNSGTSRSVEYAKRMKKEIFVIPHRLNESRLTNSLLEQGIAKPIYNIEEFANRYGSVGSNENEFIKYLNTKPTFDEAITAYGDKIYEAELEGIIAIENGYIVVKI